MLSRRQFLTRGGSAGAALVLAPQTAVEALARPKLLRGGKFSQGVLSGDPTPHGITLLTLVDEASGAGSVLVEVARDRDFRHVVAREKVATSGKRNHSVKARIGNLAPHERYFYRFETRDRHSPVGRFQTALPADSREPVRFAFFSCADYTHGYYNAYDLMRREDVDFVVCLGDYIYGESYHSVAGGTGVRDDDIGETNPQHSNYVREALTLSDYRDKYALYRSDKLLRDVHSRFPMVTIWDDHEVQDNYAGGVGHRRAGSLAALQPAAQGLRVQGVLRVDAVLRRPDQAGLPAHGPRRERRPDPARPAQVPRRPAVRRRRVAAVRRLRPAARVPGPQADELGQAAAERAPRRRGRSSARRR